MQHQDQAFDNGQTIHRDGSSARKRAISAAEIEHYIAVGKRMRSQAVAALLRAGFSRLGILLHLRPLRGERLSRA